MVALISSVPAAPGARWMPARWSHAHRPTSALRPHLQVLELSLWCPATQWPADHGHGTWVLLLLLSAVRMTVSVIDMTEMQYAITFSICKYVIHCYCWHTLCFSWHIWHVLSSLRDTLHHIQACLMRFSIQHHHASVSFCAHSYKSWIYNHVQQQELWKPHMAVDNRSLDLRVMLVLLSSDSTRFCFCEQQHRPLQQWTVQIWLAKALWSQHLPELWEWYQLRFELHISYHLWWKWCHQLQYLIAWIPRSMLWAVADWWSIFIMLRHLS